METDDQWPASEPKTVLVVEDNELNLKLVVDLLDRGMEVAEQLKADENTRNIPLVAVTAFAMSGDRQRVLESGCDDYLAKPFNVREFLSLVERYTSPNPNGTPEQVY